MIEFTLTIAIIGIGLGFWLADTLATRRFRNEAIARRLMESRHS